MTDAPALPVEVLWCPWCCEMLTESTGSGGRAPSPGDVAICWLCAKPSMYERNGQRLKLRMPWDHELRWLQADRDVRRMMNAAGLGVSPAAAMAVFTL